MSDKSKAFWFIALLSTLVIIPFLGETVFYTKGEPREAIVAYAILESGNWILPLNYGTDIAYKPLFLYWVIAAFSAILGGVTEFTSRLPSAVSFLAMQLVVFSFIAKRKDVKTAILTSILLLTSFEVHRAAVACRLDMLQVSFIVISLCLLFKWDEQRCRSFPWLAIVLMACAALTKGPVGIIFPCLVIGVYQLIRGRAFGKTFFSLAGIGLLSLIPLALWFWAAYQQGGKEFVDLMMEENTGRFFRKMSYASHENPMWYNFVTLIWGWIPWTLVLLLSLFYVKWRNIHWLPQGTSIGQRLQNGWTKFRSQSPVQLFMWLTIILIFVFYCIPKSKRSVYLLPIYPFMAVLMAEYLLALVQRGVKLFKVSAIIFASLCMLLTITFFVVRCGLIPDSVWGSGRHAADNVALMHALEDVVLSIPKWFIVILPVIAATCTFAAVAKRANTHSLLYSIAGCMLCIFVALDGVYQPTVLAVQSDKPIAERIKQYAPQGPVYSYASMSFYCTNFYLNDRMRHFSVEMPGGEGYVMTEEKLEDEFLDKFSPAYQLEKVFHTDRRSCDMRNKVCMYKFTAKAGSTDVVQ